LIASWVRDVTSSFRLDRPNVFLTGDLALRRVIEREYGFDHPPTDDELTQVADAWRPYRSLAVSYLFAAEFDAGATHPET
jgi:DNA-3-methyladenine glycosylase II